MLVVLLFYTESDNKISGLAEERKNKASPQHMDIIFLTVRGIEVIGDREKE